MIIQLGHSPIRIDIVTSIDGVEFHNAWENKVTTTYGDIEIFFISLEDLIKNKQATGRERDLLDAKYLNRIKNSKS